MARAAEIPMLETMARLLKSSFLGWSMAFVQPRQKYCVSEPPGLRARESNIDSCNHFKTFCRSGNCFFDIFRAMGGRHKRGFKLGWRKVDPLVQHGQEIFGKGPGVAGRCGCPVVDLSGCEKG